MKRSILPVLLLTVAFPLQAATNLWLHVRAVECSGSGTRVSINVPLSVVTALAPMIEDQAGDRIRLRINERDLTGAELRELVAALRNGPEGRVVTVSKRGRESTTIEKVGGNFVVRNVKSDGDTTKVTFNGAVLAALTETQHGHELDVAGAVRALARAGSGDLVLVDDGNDTVRIWIDAFPEGGR